MNKLLKLSALFLLFGFLMTSCTKEDIDPINPEVDQNLIDNITDRNELGVFSSSVIDSCDCYGAFGDIDWDNPDPAIVEAQIEAAIGSMTEAELEALFTPVCTDAGDFYANACFAECDGVTDYGPCEDGGYGCVGTDISFMDCYALNYPVTLNFSDGSTIVVSTEQEFIDAVFLGNALEFEIVYPFSVTDYLTGVVIEVTNDQEWADLGIACLGSGPIDPSNPTEECLSIVYPVTLLFGDGSVVTVADEQSEFEAIIVYIESLGTNEEPNISYEFPITVKVEDTGAILTINTEMELFDSFVLYCQ